MADTVVVAGLALAVVFLLVIAVFVRYMFKRKAGTAPPTEDPRGP